MEYTVQHIIVHTYSVRRTMYRTHLPRNNCILAYNICPLQQHINNTHKHTEREKEGIRRGFREKRQTPTKSSFAGDLGT